LYDIYYKDLPVYVSADAITHAMHYSFDKILEYTEERILYKKLDSALSEISGYIGQKSIKSNNDVYNLALSDADMYITVARRLLTGNASPNFVESNPMITEVMTKIAALDMETILLFSNETFREYDFSQLKPRGHYTHSNKLKMYFRSMMWLGRSEIFLNKPIGVYEDRNVKKYTTQEIQRMTILSALIAEATVNTGASDKLKSINEIMKSLIGRQDNINVWEIAEVLNELDISDASELTDFQLCTRYRERAMELSSANQLYNSQLVYSTPRPDQESDSLFVNPQASMLLFGQRPILDGFLTGNVVYDKILEYEEDLETVKDYIRRMVPKTSDILFALGNDAAAQLLPAELEKFKYSQNLAGLRYLINGYEDEFWKETTYSSWLNMIRALNPPKDRTKLPAFAQTAAWWQKTMTTQLASWAELRHDFILYAKQPYTTGIPLCSFPYSYVEPVPKFFAAAAQMAETTHDALEKISPTPNWDGNLKLMKHFSNTCDTLSAIAEKQLSNTTLSTNETAFLKAMLHIAEVDGCVDYSQMDGWYIRLFKGMKCDSYNKNVDCSKLPPDHLVADFHTAPTDEYGNMVGWVLHAGTGNVNLATIVTDGRAYIGPVLSYYEYTTNNFERLTDEEWTTLYKSALKPAFTNLYMADELGNDKGEYTILNYQITGVDEEPMHEAIIKTLNYPNPFNVSTSIAFTVPPSLGDEIVELKIYNLAGDLIKTLLNERMGEGVFSVKWDATNNNGGQVLPSVYVYKLNIGNKSVSGKMTLIR
jgi:hypothetical protein